jgi:DNA repair protein RecO (recombination protein O)
MHHLKVKGFVLRVVPVGDNDRIISLLTSQQGLISVSVRGARRTRSPHLLSTQIFSLSEFELFYNKGRYSLNSSQLIEPFRSLQEDVEKLVLASHLAEVVLDCIRDDLAQPVVYQLWAYSIQAVSTRPDGLLLVHVAQLRLLMEIGFSPSLNECVSCGRPLVELDRDKLFFSCTGGGLVCHRPACLARYHDNRELPGAGLDCLAHIQSASLGRLFSFTLAEDIRQFIIQLSKDYLACQMEKTYTRLDMLQNLNGAAFQLPDREEKDQPDP